MLATEFGQDTWDELNIITAGSNYGWPTVEGIAHKTGSTDPVQQWKPEAANPSGMTVINGTAFIANLRGALLQAVPIDDLAASTEYFQGRFGRIREAVRGPDGNLWLLTNNTDARGTPGLDDDRVLSIKLG